mgnify:CR=1 FL=1
MVETDAEDAEDEVEQDHDEGGEHPEVELVPVAPACADVERGDDVMRFLEEFVACPLDDAAQAKNVEEGDEEHGETAPDDIGLSHKGLID